MTREHEALGDQAGAYALGALSDAERRTFAAHLDRCHECRRETREMFHTLEVLGRAVDPTEPPPSLRARVLAQATASGQEPVTLTSHSTTASRAVAFPAWLAAAASIAALVTGLLAWSYKRDADQVRAELAAMQQQITTMTQHIATLESAAVDARQTSAVLTAVDLARVDLSGQASAPVARGRIFWSASSGLVFSATNLPALPAGRVYQLWIVAETPHSAGIVAPDAAGRLNVVSGAPVAVRPKAFALTIEPEGGRPAPTGPMFLLGAM